MVNFLTTTWMSPTICLEHLGSLYFRGGGEGRWGRRRRRGRGGSQPKWSIYPSLYSRPQLTGPACSSNELQPNSAALLGCSSAFSNTNNTYTNKQIHKNTNTNTQIKMSFTKQCTAVRVSYLEVRPTSPSSFRGKARPLELNQANSSSRVEKANVAQNTKTATDF